MAGGVIETAIRTVAISTVMCVMAVLMSSYFLFLLTRHPVRTLKNLFNFEQPFPEGTECE